MKTKTLNTAISWFKRISSLLCSSILLLAGLAMMAPSTAAAEVFRISKAFGDNMVIQQKKEIDVFGFGAEGRTVTVTLQKEGGAPIEASGQIAADGTWKVTLPAQKASFDAYTLTATDGMITQKLNNILVGELWVTGGQSNMMLTVRESAEGEEWKLKKRNPNIRLFIQSLYTTSYFALKEPDGAWYEATDWSVVENYSAVAYYFAETLYQEIQAPIGLIDTSVSGTPIWTWISRETIDTSEELSGWLKQNNMYFTEDTWSIVDGRFTYAQYQGGLYNSRVAPVAGLKAAGIVWYQGEDQVPDPAPLTYGTSLLVKDWSRLFGGGKELLPFISVQLHPYIYYEEGSLPLTNEIMNKEVEAINEAGGKAISIPIYDVSLYHKPDNHPIHPATKQPVGERCAQAAAGMVYDKLNVYSGPVPTDVVDSGDTITITFKNVGRGLSSLDNKVLTGFTLVKENGDEEVATATIASKKTITIAKDPDTQYTTVQYAFMTMNNRCNLSNKNGFVALPFRKEIRIAPAPPSLPGWGLVAVGGFEVLLVIGGLLLWKKSRKV